MKACSYVCVCVCHRERQGLEADGKRRERGNGVTSAQLEFQEAQWSLGESGPLRDGKPPARAPGLDTWPVLRATVALQGRSSP